MLVLQRQKEQKIYIGDDVCITIVDVGGKSVRIGIEAPIDVPVYRAELIPPGSKPSEMTVSGKRK